MTVIQRHRTAMSRVDLSRPMATAYNDGILSIDVSVFDYGCGRGGDLRRLGQLGIRVAGWDPNHRPDDPLIPADIVNLGYVVNVIETIEERREVVRSAWKLTRRVLVIAARPSWEARDIKGRPHRDGVLTGNDTFQKFYEQDELRTFIESTLGRRAIAAAPGIFYVFRDEQHAQAVLARRARRPNADSASRVADVLYELHRERLTGLEEFVGTERRIPQPGELEPGLQSTLVEEFGSVRAAFAVLRRATGTAKWADVDLGRPSQSERRFERHRAVLDPLMTFVADRGRLPRAGELEALPELESEFGSARAAFSLVRRVTGPERWTVLEARARRNFLVYLALAAFGGRPRFGELPDDLQFDVKDLFGNYTKAVGEADRLLFGVGDPESIDAAAKASTVGKLTPEALYVHVVAVDELPPILRVYEGCAGALSGTVEDATILKLHRLKAQVSYLSYPRFDEDPHPALSTVVVSRMGRLSLTFRDFRESENPPILHRKETFVPSGYPGRDKFARLSAQEDRNDLLSSPTIGTRQGWAERLAEAGLALRGHRLVRASR